MKDRKVDFLIIGAQKAGTTSLYHYLVQHPDICFSKVKEVNYFAIDRLYEKGTAYYHSYFSDCKTQRAIGSAYTHLLPCHKSAQRIKDYNPDMKLIVLLREPAERAWSAYQYARRNGWEPKTTGFLEALEREPERLREERFDLTYFFNGLYHSHLSHWTRVFPRDQLLLLRHADLSGNTQQVMKRVFEFIGVGPMDVDTSKRYNEASGVHSSRLQRVMLAKRRQGGIRDLVPQPVKVFIRSKVFPLVYRMNRQRDFESLPFPESERKAIAHLFSEDLANLRSDYGIGFDS